MKKLVFLGLFSAISMVATAQTTGANPDVTYTVKENRIFIGEDDVTDTLSLERKDAILAAHNEQEKQQLLQDAEKALEETKAQAEKEQKRLEKAHKKALKEQKKAEKALKKQEKAKKNYSKAKEKYEAATSKYNKLKKRGDLSPNDEAKWLDKMEKLKGKLDKATRKL
ncbi:MAG: hypothetical protein GYB39_02845 [Algicola sp.]|nr:hypothetical protein [Algicola sp.]